MLIARKIANDALERHARNLIGYVQMHKFDLRLAALPGAVAVSLPAASVAQEAGLQGAAPVDGAAAAAPIGGGAASTPIDAALLPQDLSPWGMFATADVVVQTVMIGLALASVLTWTVWLAKSLELRAARRRAHVALATLGTMRSLSETAARLRNASGAVGALSRAAEVELRLSADAVETDGLKERIASRLERIEAAAGRQMTRGTGILATIGSTAPFVGLFGTVWGIMNSFVGISEAHTTNLAVVAPGIAEALLATALGLVAAVPAVVIYNVFARSIAGYRALLADASAEVLRLISRDLDRQQGMTFAKAAE